MELIEPEDNATIIFTSGTTGTPKGVMLTHKNYTVQLSAIHNFIYCKKGEWWMTILPVWHSFERIIQYIAILFTAGLAYSKPVASIMLADLAVIKPQWICGVPRNTSAIHELYNRLTGQGESIAGLTDKINKNTSAIHSLKNELKDTNERIDETNERVTNLQPAIASGVSAYAGVQALMAKDYVEFKFAGDRSIPACSGDRIIWVKED